MSLYRFNETDVELAAAYHTLLSKLISGELRVPEAMMEEVTA